MQAKFSQSTVVQSKICFKKRLLSSCKISNASSFELLKRWLTALQLRFCSLLLRQRSFDHGIALSLGFWVLLRHIETWLVILLLGGSSLSPLRLGLLCS